MQEAKNSPSLLEQFVNLFPDLFCIASDQGSFLWLNSMWEEVAGWSPEALKTRKFFDYIHESDRQSFEQLIAQHGEEAGARLQQEIRFEKADQHYVWLQCNVLVEGHGLLYISVRDVSVKKEIEHQVEEQTRRLLLAERVGKIGHWRIDMSTPTHQLTWSDEVYRICGVDKDAYELNHRSAIDLYHPDDRPAVRRMVTAAMEHGEDFAFELRMVRPDGEIRQVGASGICELDESGNVSAVFGVFQDITEQKKAEKALYDQMIERERLSERLKQLHRITAEHYEHFEDLYQDYLKLGNKVFRTGTAILSRIVDQEYLVFAAQSRGNVEAGQRFELIDTLCNRVIEQGRVVAYEHIGALDEMKTHPVYLSMKLESYIGVPVLVDGKVFGTLNFSDTRVKKVPFNQYDVEFLTLMAQGVGAAIEKHQSEQLRMATQAELKISEERFKNAFKHAPVGVALVDLEGHWVQVNQSMLRLTGYEEEELLSKDLDQISFEGDRKTDAFWKKALLEGHQDSANVERRIIGKDGEMVWTMMGVSLLWQGTTPLHYIMQFIDITDQKRAQEMLEGQRRALVDANTDLQKLSSLDPLTGLLNRRAFDTQRRSCMDQAFQRQLPVSVMMVDVDHFKTFNDTYGHSAGDVVLKEVARLIQGNARGSDVVARFGGEEFVVLLPGAEQRVAMMVAERLRKKIERFAWEHRKVTVSIGLVTEHAHQNQPQDEQFAEMLELADQALYRSKETGRNRVTHFNDC